jgi:proline iminopeptidase
MKMKLLVMVLLAVAGSELEAQQPTYRDGTVTTADSATLYYRIWGERGDTIVFLHGGPGGSLEGQAEFLAPLSKKHVLIAYDQRGAGLSGAVDSTRINVPAHVADLEALRKHLNVSAMTLWGHSWGTGLAVMYTHQHPAHVKRLVLNGPMPPAFEPFDVQRTAAIENAIRRICIDRAGGQPTGERDAALAECMRQPNMIQRAYFHDTTLIKRFGRDRRSATAEQNARQALANRVTLRSLGKWDYRPMLASIRVPALIVEGAHTPVPMEHLLVWKNALPNARLLLVPKTGHGYPHNENPDYFFPAIEDFLAAGWPKDAK